VLFDELPELQPAATTTAHNTKTVFASLPAVANISTRTPSAPPLPVTDLTYIPVGTGSVWARDGGPRNAPSGVRAR